MRLLRRVRPLSWPLWMAVAASAMPAVAWADEPEPSASANRAASWVQLDASELTGGAGAVEPPERDRWRWERVSSGEYVLMGTLLAGAIALELADPDLGYSWDGGILFDDRARSSFRARSARGRYAAALVSDVLYYGLTLSPVMVDGLGALAGSANRRGAAAQMLAIDMTSLALTGFLATMSKNFARRHRPPYEDCDDAPGGCREEPRSFFSGHTAMSFTGAGLMCAHGAATGLYGAPRVARAVCGGALVAASLVGVLRMVADRHFATDVLIGAAVGLVSGFLLPRLLHYGRAAEDDVGGAQGVLTTEPSRVTAGFGFAHSW